VVSTGKWSCILGDGPLRGYASSSLADVPPWREGKGMRRIQSTQYSWSAALDRSSILADATSDAIQSSSRQVVDVLAVVMPADAPTPSRAVT
jgi:hypothetical protein